MTGILIDRFFNRMKFKDLVVKYDLDSKMTAQHYYHDAVKRIYEILDVLERERRARYKLESMNDKVLKN